MAKTEDKALITKKQSEITKKDVASAKHKEQIRTIERQGRIASWNEYIGFGVSKVLGLGGLTIGGLETLDPNILPIVLSNPEIVAGVGLALLTGKSIISLITKVEKSLRG
jgi:hypothetical protein